MGGPVEPLAHVKMIKVVEALIVEFPLRISEFELWTKAKVNYLRNQINGKAQCIPKVKTRLTLTPLVMFSHVPQKMSISGPTF